MSVIQVMVQFHPSEFGPDIVEVATDAADTIRSRLPDHEVEVRFPQGAGGGDGFLEIARTLFVSIPWDILAGAAAGVLLETLRDWLTARVRQVKDIEVQKVDRLEGRGDFHFPAGATRDKKNDLLRTVPYSVQIYGPRGQLLASIEQDESMEEAVVKTIDYC
ncbi:MAG: hypothetical protein M3464_05305 [Chloroflexota bacterium]|nr:hypothetical protein [Chloroflexota bacterium]